MRNKLLWMISISACCVLGNPFVTMAQEYDKELIGVASIFDDAGWQSQKQYFNEVIGPAFNMEFVFSGKLSNENDLTDFMEQSIALGCTGIINMVTQDEAVVAGAKLAEESNIWYVTQNSMISEDVATLTHNLGHVGASVSGIEAAYKDLVTELIEKEGRNGFFIYTGSAAGGDSGKGASSHFHSVKGMLEAIAETYHFEYKAPVEDLINSKTSGYIDTDRDDVTIFLSSTGQIVDGVEEAKRELDTGLFDTLITVTSYSSFTGITNRAEMKLDDNIMLIATVSDDQMTKAGFETKDTTGDSVLHAGVINPLSTANALCSMLLYKGFSGEADSMKDDGHTKKYEVEPIICYDAAQYSMIDEEIKSEITNMLKE